jgi:hypothetical protein
MIPSLLTSVPSFGESTSSGLQPQEMRIVAAGQSRSTVPQTPQSSIRNHISPGSLCIRWCPSFKSSASLVADPASFAVPPQPGPQDPKQTGSK